MSATLYQMKKDWLDLYEMMSDDTQDEDVILDTLLGVDYEIEQKAEGYAMVRAQLKADAEAIKAEEERLYARRKAIENNIKRLEGNLQDAMELTGKTKFKTSLFSFGIQNNAPSVVIDDETSIPEEYLIQQEPKVNKTAIKEAIKNGAEFTFAHMEQSRSLRIR